MKVLCKNVPRSMDKEQYKNYAAALLKSTYAAGNIVRKKNESEPYEPIALQVKKEQRQVT